MKHSRLVVGWAALVLVACKTDPKVAPATAASAATPPPSASVATVPSVPAPPAAPFEGEIVMTVKDEHPEKVPSTITFDVKGERVRYAASGSKVRAIADGAGQRAYAVDDALRLFTVFDTRPVSGTTPLPAAPTVTKSPWAEKVAGLACQDWSIDDGKEKVDVCAAKGIPFFDLAREPKVGTTEPLWASALTREKAFPLRVVVHDSKGKEEYRAEATKVDARKVDDAGFQVPSGFKPADLSNEVRTASLP